MVISPDRNAYAKIKVERVLEKPPLKNLRAMAKKHRETIFSDGGIP